MRYLSVCSGIEAATVAWEPLGWEALAFSEVAAFPRALLGYRYPFTHCHDDFTTIGAKYHGTTDVLIGGTPCQDFSVAGLRKGLAGDRGNLTIEFVRLVEKTRPRWVVWENVPGVLSIDKGRAFGTFLKGLAECGYGFAYRVLDAQYFGVPQRRRRVFVVGYIGDWRPAAAVLFECEGLQRDITPRRKTRENPSCDVREGIANTIGAHKSGGWGVTDIDTAGAFIPEIAGCLQERDSKGCDSKGCDSDTKPGHLIPFYSNMSGTQRSAASDQSLALKTAGSNAICIKGAAIGRKPENGSQYGEILDDDTCYTLSCNEPHAVATFKPGQSADSRSIGFNENIAPSLEAGVGGGQ